MSQKSVTKRIKISKNGKILRRAMSLGHSRGNKTSNQMYRKKNGRTLVMNPVILKKYF
ncbi:MAG: hypothetical protein AAB432_01330 [Patescibacteria group bacterium]